LLDLDTGMRGCVHGTLLIEPDRLAPGAEALTHVPDGEATGLRWSEAGQLTWGGLQIPVTRELRLLPTSQAGRGWRMTFADGRPFHPWQPGIPVEHPCGKDHYRGRIELLDDDRMRMEWVVTGPRKNQQYETRFRRLPDG
jgi:hypothetical protein